jgi:hypothetical protein
MIVAVMQGRPCARQQFGQPRLALDQRQRGHVLAVEMQQIENEIHQPGRVAGVRRGLDHAEGRDAVREGAAQFAVGIGLARIERRHGFGDGRIFVRPVEAGAGQQLHSAAVEPRMHAVAVELDFVQPLAAFRRRVDQLCELRRDPFRQRGRVGAPPRYGAGHGGEKERLPGRRMRLLELVDLADMLG